MRRAFALLIALTACSDVRLPTEPSSLTAAPGSRVASSLADLDWGQSTTGYDMLLLGQINGSTTVPEAINEAGQVVGYYYAETSVGQRQQAFLWENGVFTPLGTLGGNSSMTTFISNSGAVVGWAFDAYEQMRPVVWERGANGYAIRELPLLSSWGGNGFARSMNAKGEIVGASTSELGIQHATRWTKHGTPVDLGVLEGSLISSADFINKSGTIVGFNVSFSPFASTPTVWDKHDNASVLAVPDIASRNIETSQAINERGDVTCSFQDANFFVTSACVVRDGQYQLLPTLGSCYTFPFGINDASDVAGASNDTQSFQHAVVWPGDGSALIDLGFATVDGRYSIAHGINNNGLVTGVSATYNVATGVWRIGGAIWRARR